MSLPQTSKGERYGNQQHKLTDDHLPTNGKNLKWHKEQSTSTRYLWSLPVPLQTSSLQCPWERLQAEMVNKKVKWLTRQVTTCFKDCGR